MTWLKLDDGFPNHPKVALLPLKARWLLIEGGCWSARYLTDGGVPREIAHGWQGVAMVRAVVTAGLWHQGNGCGTETCIEGDGSGYVIHDFLRYNPSREESEQKRSKRQAAGRAGGQASARARARPTVEPETNPVPSRPVQVEPKDQSAAAPRTRDPLFDALAAVSGADPREMTEAAARACGVALAEIRKVAPNLTPEEIARRAANYPTHFGDAALTPSALAKHWATCNATRVSLARDNAAAIMRSAM